MQRDFNIWFSKFKHSISTYDYYVNFPKVICNVEKRKIELNILNALIGSKNIEADFENIITRYPETLQCIPLLLAVRENEICAQDEEGAFVYRFDKQNLSIGQYKVFMRKTGLFDMIANHLINNLVDYAYGVETGLDSNGRKNRGGHQMEALTESFIKKAGGIKGVNYFKEMKLSDLEKAMGLDLSNLSNQGQTEKRFDYVIKTKDIVYAVEVNFYTVLSGGSKLNETAHSYKLLAQEAKGIKDFKFVWVTDGPGWKRAENNLKEVFDMLDTLYNIDDMENGIFQKMFA